MLWRDNERKNKSSKETDKKIDAVSDKATDNSDNISKAYEDVRALREKIEALKVQKKTPAESAGENSPGAKDDGTEERIFDAEKTVKKGADQERERNSEVTSQNSENSRKMEIEAAERAVFVQAQKDAEIKKNSKEEHLLREARIKVARIREKEARLRAEKKELEAQIKKRKLKEATEKAEALKTERKKAEIEAQLNEIREKENSGKKEEIKEKTGKERFEAFQKRLEAEQNEQKNKEFARIKKETEKLKRQQNVLERRNREATEKKAALKNEQERKRQEERKEKEKREKLILEQRKIQRKKREEAKARAKAEARRRKAEREAARSEEKKARKERIKAERKEKNELRRQRKAARKSAEMGGGIVNVHGTTVKTEIKPVATYSVKDLIGASKLKEIRETSSESEKEALLEENERIKTEARATAAKLAQARKIRVNSNPLKKKVDKLLQLCDEKKKIILTAFSVVLIVLVGSAAVINYCTVYEYSYNGVALGYTKNKDNVLQITEMVQNALTEEKKVDVVIDARDDITFTRVSSINKDLVIDTQEEVLKRLTHMNDINVKAYGIFVDGKKVGAVSEKEDAATTLEKIKDKYASNKSGSEIKEAVIIEDIVIRKSNTPLGDVLSAKAMAKKLSTDTLKESVHTVARGETLSSIAKDHNISKEEIVEDNPDIDFENLEVGTTLKLEEMAPMVTVKITEERKYAKKTDYKTIKKKDKELYEGYTEVDKEGQKGVSTIKDRTVSINGEVVQTKILENKVKRAPVDKIVRIGTKERPPTVGSGTYIWPAYSGTYTVTSEFKWRWGRQHEGIDLGCSVGTDVLASDGGTVTYAGYMGGYGNLVIIDHQNGIKTYYGHNSSLCVSVGDKVFQGQHIAEAGSTGRSTGPHIHFGVMENGKFYNPRNYLP